jgi:hypothetical protein
MTRTGRCRFRMLLLSVPPSGRLFVKVRVIESDPSRLDSGARPRAKARGKWTTNAGVEASSAC